MSDILLTISQTFDMMTLAPCIVVIIFLILSCKKYSSVLIPILYFVSLACGLLLPVLPAFISLDHRPYTVGLLIFGKSFNVALNYLFIIQLILGRTPSILYYWVLAVPIFGGSSYIIASQLSDETCIMGGGVCIATSYAVTFYNLFSSALIFLLLVIFISRSFEHIRFKNLSLQHKYWLLLSLIIFNLMLLGLDLWNVTHNISMPTYLLAEGVIKVGFIYIALTSIFRVFNDVFYKELMHTISTRTALNTKERLLARKIEELMQHEKLYTDLNFNRKMLAEYIGIKEHQLSTIISIGFKKSFSEYVNDYRIEQAKRLLLENPQNPVTVIAYDTGFNSLTSFNRVFKEFTGLSPTEFRTTKITHQKKQH